jgi:hypothetical protein
MLAGISKAAVEREAAMMEASSNFIWARKLRALRAALDEAEADNARLRAALECLLIEYDYAELAQAEPPSLTAAVFSARDALNTGKEPSHE